MKKKFMSILLVLAMCFTMLPMSVFAAEGDTFEGDGLTYTVLSEDGSTGTVSLTGGINASGDISIPATVTKDSFTYTVTTIGNDAFYGCTGLTAISIPSNVKNIGSGAFNGCTNLASVNISDGVQEIRNGAFYGCTALTSITIPDSVDLIGSAAFQGCTGLTSVTIPSGVRTISSDAFNGCTGLTSVTISDGVTQIGTWTFANCTSLTSITIPDSVTKIYDFAFSGCTALTNIYYEGTAEEWAAISIEEGAIPDDVTIHTTNPELIITGGTEGTDFTYENGLLDIKAAGTYEIKNADPATATDDIIKVSAPSGMVNITLGGVNIATTEGMSVPAFEIIGDCKTNITLADNTKNILNSYESKEGILRNYAGLQNGEHLLTISCAHSEEAEHICNTACGSLEAVGGIHAACIGGGYGMHGNNITISGGNIVAISQGNACIGGGNSGNGNHITISGGIVTATSQNSAGIGGGNGGDGSNITISGGIITATSAAGAGIGGGNGGDGSNITISGGIVTATGQDAGIGGDDQGSCSNVTISGGVVTAKSTLGVGIGHGANGGTAENIVIAPAANMKIYAYNGSDNTGDALYGSPFTTETDITNLLSGKAFYSVAEHVHSFSTDWTHDSANHWHVATCCDGVVSDKEAHSGGTATCTEKAICTTCDQPYGEVLGHTYGTEWKSDGTNHWHECSCGAKTEEAAHSGGTATCTEKAICTACGEEYGDLADHSFSADWSYDVDKHWHDATCGHDAVSDTAAHSYGIDRVCDICGYTKPAPRPSYDNDDYTPPKRNEPELGNNGGWDEIQEELQDLSDAIESGEVTPGETVTVEMNGATEVPAEVLSEIAGQDINVEFDMGGGVTWTVNGQDVPADIGDLNLGIETGGNSIPVNVVNTITGEESLMQLELDHNGPFGATIHLSLDLGRESAGHWANLYYYDGQDLYFRHSDRIDSRGRAVWPFDRASSYMVVVDDENHAPNPFADVSEEDWCYEAVRYVYDNGMMSGYPGNLFGPNDSITRGQIVTILHRLEGTPVVDYLMTYEDVDQEMYYAEAIRWATSEGIVAGYGNGKFGPDDPITRQQLATILWRYSQHKGYDVSVGEDTNILSYEDAFDISEYAIPAMQWACGAGVMGGYGNGYLGPNDGATRAQAAQMLKNFIEKAAK